MARHEGTHGGVLVHPKWSISVERVLNKLRFHVSRKKKVLLDSYGWYPNLLGGWTHPHAMDYMGRLEIARKTMDELEYALRHGSRSPYRKGGN